MVIENPGLQRRQWINILHVRHAARHTGSYLIDLHLRQTDQRQQLRGDKFAAFRNQVGRHYNFRTTADRRCQRGQGWLAEQHAHIGTQADLAHALDQLHRQQRVAAQFEEMIMTPYLLDLEHVGPDRRQQGFDFALRGFIATADQRLRIRRWQRPAIELAVGGQWQGIELHVGRRYHIVR